VDDDNPYAAPKSLFLDDELVGGFAGETFADGKLLAVRNGAVLPDRCLKCNAPAEGYQFSRSLAWHRPIWYVLILISLLLYVLVYFFVRWKAKVTVGVCPRHRRRRTRAIALGWLTALAGIGTIIAAASLPDGPNSIGIVAGIIAVAGGIIGGMLGSRIFVVNRIDKEYVWLSHVSPEYLASFEA
jgi:hypothetical protein